MKLNKNRKPNLKQMSKDGLEELITRPATRPKVRYRAQMELDSRP